MHLPSRLVIALAVLGLLIVLGTQAPAADTKAKKDPPGTETIMANLRAWFAKHANKDHEIGKLEAAKAFGYSQPYDAGPIFKTPTGKPKEDDKDKDKDKDSSSGTGSASATPQKADK